MGPKTMFDPTRWSALARWSCGALSLGVALTAAAAEPKPAPKPAAAPSRAVAAKPDPKVDPKADPKAAAKSEADQLRASLCTAARAQQASYVSWWKKEFGSRNAIDDAAFAQRVNLGRPELQCGWVSGILLRINYTLSFGWAQVAAHDDLVLALYSTESAYPQSRLPRDKLWQPLEVGRAMHERLFTARINEYDFGRAPMFATEADTRARLVDHLGGLSPERTELSIARANCTSPCTPGHPTVFAIAATPEAPDLCRQVDLDLLTGENVVREGPCKVSGAAPAAPKSR